MALCLSAGLGAACGNGSASVAQQLTSWAQSTDFSSTLSAVRGDLAAEAQYAAAGAPATHARTVCDVLVTDTLHANEQLPTPDSTLTGLLGRAYDAAASAGHDCYDAAGADSPKLAAAATLRTTALGLLIRAEARYDQLTSTLPQGAT